MHDEQELLPCAICIKYKFCSWKKTTFFASLPNTLSFKRCKSLQTWVVIIQSSFLLLFSIQKKEKNCNLEVFSNEIIILWYIQKGKGKKKINKWMGERKIMDIGRGVKLIDSWTPSNMVGLSRVSFAFSPTKRGRVERGRGREKTNFIPTPIKDPRESSWLPTHHFIGIVSKTKCKGKIEGQLMCHQTQDFVKP